MSNPTRMQQTKDKIMHLAKEQGLLEDHIRVKTSALTPTQAIGTPIRQDYPILTGKEVIVEAEFRGNFGQAFTDQPQEFEGSLKEILQLDLEDTGNRAILLATINAITSYLNIADRVRHCKDEEPESCAAEMTKHLLDRFGRIKIGMVGYQPALLEQLARTFGTDCVICTDLSPINIGSNRYGVSIWNGKEQTSELIDWCDLVLATSSTFSNGTFDEIEFQARQKGKNLIVFGITGAGVAALTGIERLCYCGH